MGIRRSYGRNRKSNRPTDAATVERQDLLRRAANVRSQFDATRRAHRVSRSLLRHRSFPRHRPRHRPRPGPAEEGADVAVNYVSSDHLAKDIVDQIQKKGRQAILAQGDVADYADTDRMASPGPASTSAPAMATTSREPSSASTAAYSCSAR